MLRIGEARGEKRNRLGNTGTKTWGIKRDRKSEKKIVVSGAHGLKTEKVIRKYVYS